MKICIILLKNFTAVFFEKVALWNTRLVRATRAPPWVCPKPNRNPDGVAQAGAGVTARGATKVCVPEAALQVCASRRQRHVQPRWG
jgi:hypothetical protein